MKKLLITSLLVLACAGMLFAQNNTTAAASTTTTTDTKATTDTKTADTSNNDSAKKQDNGNLSDPNPETVGNDSAMEALREISVDKFEREGAWNVRMSPDYGVISARLFTGSPAMKEPLPEDKDSKKSSSSSSKSDTSSSSTSSSDSKDSSDSGDSDTQVLGVKVEFFKRGVNSFYITSVRPLPIEGTTKTISVWVCGRNQDHDMYVLLQDYFGNNFEIYLGSLGFSGWKKLTCVIPPSSDGVHGIVQHSAYYGDRPGVRIIGFRVDCNPMLARGSYYMYLDDLRAVTDLFDMENHDEDDMPDNW